ncbi:MAG: hypothetical protein NT062_07035 [Proteobacteria bacterium]|nr:hypothetical protein [Pseudomonadota bacterium]
MVGTRLILVVVLAGCLSKPSLYVDAGHDGVSSADAIGIDTPIGPPGCTGRTAFPAGLVLRGATVGDLDRRTGGNLADDILVWGRENGTGDAHVYLMSGHPEMTGTCYDDRFDFVQAAVDPIDVWIGEVTGDTDPDMLMLANEDAGMGTEIILRAGDAMGFPTTEVTSTTLPTGGLFQTPWGGTLASPLPAFVTGA